MAVAVARPLYYNEKHNANLLQDLNRERFETDSFCDATLQVDDKTFNVHKCIVGRLSSFFRNLFKVEMKEKFDSFANMKGLTSEIMDLVLNYIYTGTVNINEENVFDLVAASDYLLIEGLKVCCQDYMIANITSDNCIKYYLAGKTYKWALLKQKGEKLFRTNFKEITKQKEFAALERDDLLYILSRLEDVPSSFRERSVYEGILAWVKHDIETRKQFLPEMLDLVVFKFFSQQYLKTIKNEYIVQEVSGITALLNDEIELKQARSRGKRNLFVEVNATKVRLFDLLMSWIELPDLPNDAGGACVVAYQNHLYVIGGGQDTRSIQRLKLDDNEAIWENAGQTLKRRSYASAVVLNDSIVISGNRDQVDYWGANTVECFLCINSCIDDVEQYEMEFMSCKHSHHSMVECNGSIYCFGGRIDSNSEKYSRRRWNVLQPEKKFKSCVAAASDNEIYVFDAELKLEIYDLDLNAWRTRSECPFKYTTYTASYMEGKVYTFGQRGYQYILGEYDISLDSWRMVCSSPCGDNSSRFFASI